jgi:hypothetical protein
MGDYVDYKLSGTIVSCHFITVFWIKTKVFCFKTIVNCPAIKVFRSKSIVSCHFIKVFRHKKLRQSVKSADNVC